MEQLQLDNTKKFKPTVAWIAEYYNKANEWLFNGRLGDCAFKAEPITKHSSWLGMFSMQGVYGAKVYADRRSRRLFVEEVWNDREYINRDNFVELCHPAITLSTYYSGTEYSLFCTLVHEMCHYYTYMNGYAPKQAHGPEFRDIGYIVANRSGNLFTIQRLASAEQMTGYELDAELAAKKKQRAENKKLRAHYIIVVRNNGERRLINTHSQSVMLKILETEKNYMQAAHHLSAIVEVTNSELTEEIYNSGYRSEMRKYTYWPINTTNRLIDKVLSSETNYKIIAGANNVLTKYLN